MSPATCRKKRVPLAVAGMAGGVGGTGVGGTTVAAAMAVGVIDGTSTRVGVASASWAGASIAVGDGTAAELAGGIVCVSSGVTVGGAAKGVGVEEGSLSRLETTSLASVGPAGAEESAGDVRHPDDITSPTAKSQANKTAGPSFRRPELPHAFIRHHTI